jgi:tRNA pseudouridine38-40 synthase
VHALAHPVAFDPSRSLPTRAWAHNINRGLPEEIVVKRVFAVQRGYDPRREARHKTYRYVVRQAKVRDPFEVARSWRLPERLNHVIMAQAAQALLGEHDFRAFRGAQDDRENTVRRILRVEVRKGCSDDEVVEIIVQGTGFLYKMVRIIAGSLVEIGRDRLSPECFERAFATGDRGDLGITAPAGGLYLQHVELAGSLDDEWPNATTD